MKEFASAFLYPPFPFVLLLVAGMVVRRYTRFRCIGQRAEAIAVVALVLSMVPLTAKIMLVPLLQAVPIWQDEIHVGAIVVPTAGAYKDIRGRGIRAPSRFDELVMPPNYRPDSTFRC